MYKLLLENHLKTLKTLKIFKRNVIICRYLLSKTLLVHNGRKMVEVPINKYRFGRKLGEYSFTRTFKGHYKKKKKK